MLIFLSLLGLAIVGSFLVLIYETHRMRIAPLDDLASVDAETERRRRAKRLNERLKLTSSFANGLGVAFVATSLLAPLASSNARIGMRDALLAVAIVAMLHGIGLFVLHFWKDEG